MCQDLVKLTTKHLTYLYGENKIAHSGGDAH